MLKMGCAKADVTPGFEVYIRGYASRNRVTCEVEESVEAGVIALEQNGKKTLLITVDSLGIEVAYCQKIYKAIAEAVNIDYPNILIACSHTHFAPNFGGFTVYFPNGELELGNHPEDTRYYEFFMSKLIPAVKYAVADLEEVELLQADIPVSSIAFNRRTIRKADGMVTTNYMYPDDPENYDFSDIDTVMHVWKFMRNNAPKGILARYGCHPVTGGYNSYGISADYPGYLKEYIREKFHCPGFFMLGTAGDVVPMQRNNESRKDIGQVMASSIRLAGRTFRRTTDFELKTAAATLKVISRNQGKSQSEIAQKWQDELARAQQNKKYSQELYTAGMAYEIYNEFNGHEADLPIQLMQLGDRTIAALPFEVLTIIGKKIREVFPDAAVVSCAGGYECYLPTAADFPKGGYETYTGTVWQENTGDNVIAKTIEMLKDF